MCCNTGGSARKPEQLCEASTAARLTCLAALDLISGSGQKQSRARKAAHREAKHRADADSKADSDSLEAVQAQQVGKKNARGEPQDPVAQKKEKRKALGAATTQSLPGELIHSSKAGKSTDAEREQAKQESLEQARLKRLKREEMKAAAEAQKSGVLVQKEAETVVEFPEVIKPPKAAKKGKKGKKGQCQSSGADK